MPFVALFEALAKGQCEVEGGVGHYVARQTLSSMPSFEGKAPSHRRMGTSHVRLPNPIRIPP